MKINLCANTLCDWRGFAVRITQHLQSSKPHQFSIFFRPSVIRYMMLLLAVTFLLPACHSYEKTVYLQHSGHAVTMTDSSSTLIPEPLLKVGDLLTITVNSLTPEAAAPFNLPLIPGGEAMKAYSLSDNVSMGGGAVLQNYLIDTNGDLVFPVIGKLHVAGLTKSALSELIKSKIYPAFIKEEPILYIRFAAFKVSVLGEVMRPGTYPVNNERISVLEAIAQAGDLSVYGQRKNVLLVRESFDGKRESIRLDLTDKNLIHSPYYFLQQNDVLYVEPNGPKARSRFFGTAESLSISIVGTLISLTSLIVMLTR